MDGGQVVVRRIMNTFHKLDIRFLGTDIRAAAPGLLTGEGGGDVLSFPCFSAVPGALGLEGTPQCDRDCGPVRVPDFFYPEYSVIDLERRVRRRRTPRL